MAAPLLALFDAFIDQDGRSSAPNPVVIGLAGLLAFGLTRWLGRRGLSLRAMRIALVLGAVIAVLTLVPAQELGSVWNPDALGVMVLASLALVIAWWRGLSYGADPEPFTPDRLNGLVKLAWIALAALVVLTAAINGFDTEPAERVLLVAMPVAAVAGMVLLALGQVEQARINARKRGGRAPERRGWLIFATVFAVLLLIVATLGSAILGGDAAGWVLTPLGYLLRGVTFVLEYLIIGIALIFFVLFYPLFWLLRQLRSDEPQQQQEQQGGSGELEQLVREGGDGLPDAVQTAAQIGAVVLVIAVVGVLLAISLRKYRRPPESDDSEEERESLWSRDLATAQLKGLFRRGDHATGPDRIDLSQPPPTVRDAYRALQALAIRDGVPREASETPAEFAARLRRAWPSPANTSLRTTRRS
jgi:type II secretory pathway pseudopilin PulG